MSSRVPGSIVFTMKMHAVDKLKHLKKGGLRICNPRLLSLRHTDFKVPSKVESRHQRLMQPESRKTGVVVPRRTSFPLQQEKRIQQDYPGVCTHRQAREGELAVGKNTLPSVDLVDCFQQFPRRRAFKHESAYPCCDCTLLIGVGIKCSQNDDACFWKLRPNRNSGVDAAHIREPEIHE